VADWIKKGERIKVVKFDHSFAWDLDDPHSGFGFPCNEDGTPIEDEYVSSWGPNYEACLTGVVDDRPIFDVGIQRYEHSYWEPGELRCVCGAVVVIDMLMTNTCRNCGRDYNSSGQLLAPREQWGWDTGESLGEILSADQPLR
jgi:hypothetical protein